MQMEVNNFAFHSSYPQSWDAELEFLNCWVQGKLRLLTEVAMELLLILYDAHLFSLKCHGT